MIVTTAARRTSKRANPDPVVLIRSSAHASLPAPGNRVDTDDSANMPLIQGPNDGNPAIVAADGAHHYRLVGLNIQASQSALTYTTVKIGGQETTLAEFPTDITIDRCIVKGGGTSVATQRGVELDGIRCAVIDSYIYDIKYTNDSQAVWAYNAPGPLKIVNNYLSATGENVMFGGADPSYTNGVPSDIEIRRNHFKKESLATWAASWSVKNLLELKNAERVLVEGNVFDTSYGDSQSGYGWLITPRNQDGNAEWCRTRDITLRYNHMKNVEAGITISGADGGFTSQRTYRINIENNLLELANLGGGGAARIHQMLGGAHDVQFIHNTWIGSVAYGTLGFHENDPPSENTVWRDNIFSAMQNGLLGTGTSTPQATFATHFTNHSWTYNILYSSPGGTYSGTGNQFPANLAAVGFTDSGAGDYSLSGSSTYKNDASDGTDPGVDWTELQAQIANAVDGQWGSEHATYTDTTYDNAELPRSYIDTTYANQAGTTHVCTTAAQFTTALENCSIGDIIELQAGTTFSGTFTLRNIT